VKQPTAVRAAGREPVLLHRRDDDGGARDGRHRGRARGAAHSGRAVLPGARPRPAGAVDRPRARRSRPADRQVFYRETVRAVAHRHGSGPRSRPSPSSTRPATGATSTSACGTRQGRRSRMYDPRGRYGVSALGLPLHRGVLEHLPALLALTCPSVNSYPPAPAALLELGVHGVGPDNREAAVRVPSTFPVRPRRLDQCRAQGVRLVVESLSRPGRIARGRARRRHAQARAGEPVLVDPAPCPTASGESAGSSGTRPRCARRSTAGGRSRAHVAPSARRWPARTSP
jgi:hypothetical protein